MKNLKVYVYMFLFVLVVISFGVATLMFGTEFNPFYIYGILFVFGFEIVHNAISISKGIGYVPMSTTKDKFVEAEQELKPLAGLDEEMDKKKKLTQQIINQVNNGHSLQTIGQYLVKMGYTAEFVNGVFQELINDGLIIVKQPEEPVEEKEVSKEEIRKQELLDRKKKIEAKMAEIRKQTEELEPDTEVEEEDDDSEDVKKTLSEIDKRVKAKEDGKKAACPKCGKKFKDEVQMRRHYGMSHYKDIEI